MLEFSDKLDHEQQNCMQIRAAQALQFVRICQPKSFSGCKIIDDCLKSEQEEFWRLVHACLKDDSTVQITNISAKNVKLESLLKMTGFTNIFYPPNGSLTVQKPAFRAGGTSLKDRRAKAAKKEEPANPWANLSQTENGQINEDDLMNGQDESKVIAEAQGNCDRIMPGKPCANCTCGKAEYQESQAGIDKLEMGQVESDCGKCYLGDAFRCASCPYKGQPAFEAGDKVKLQNAGVSEMQKPIQAPVIKEGNSKVVLEL